MYIIDQASIEYLRVPVAAETAGLVVDPTTQPVTIAVVPTGTEPVLGDFDTAAWETNATTDPDTYYAYVLIGPPPGLVTLTAGSIYDVYIKIIANPETIIRNTGYLAAM